jgi:DNA-binding CsgD family transcriptional regulator
MDNFKGRYLESEIDKFTQLIENNINTKDNLSQLKKVWEEYFIYRQNKEFTQKEESLSTRENECYLLLMAGKTNREIAKELWITENTVKKHVSNIYSKMGVKNKGQLMAYRGDGNVKE